VGEADEGALDLVTVVYRAELPLLRLQARSVARFLDPERIGRILVVVNDRFERACRRGVEALRPEYGAFADRLEVLTPDALFALRPAALGPRGTRQRLWSLGVRHGLLYPFGLKGGWRGNRGWRIQQALKLAIGRYGEGGFVLILDAKNHFIAPVSRSSFVSPAGRARSYEVVAGRTHWSWVGPSCALLGVEPPARETPVPPTVTPVVLPRAVLRAAVDAVEARVGPVEGFFMHGRKRQTEFMLIFAHVLSCHGTWGAVFDPGLRPAATIFGRAGPEEVAAVLDRAEAGGAEVFSVHSGQRGRLPAAVRARIEALWARLGLLGPGEPSPLA
jgi:hypothetical protein